MSKTWTSSECRRPRQGSLRAARAKIINVSTAAMDALRSKRVRNVVSIDRLKFSLSLQKPTCLQGKQTWEKSVKQVAAAPKTRRAASA
jgi:hypothetical protein